MAFHCKLELLQFLKLFAYSLLKQLIIAANFSELSRKVAEDMLNFTSQQLHIGTPIKQLLSFFNNSLKLSLSHSLSSIGEGFLNLFIKFPTFPLVLSSELGL